VSRIACIFLLCLFCVAPGTAQEASAAQEAFPEKDTHADFLSELVQECLDEVAADHSSLRIKSQGKAAFAVGHVVRNWTAAGKSIYLDDAPGPENNLLVFTVDTAEITFERINKNLLSRSAEIALTYWLSDPQGRVLQNDSCQKTADDELSRKDARALADTRYPETDPSLPSASRWRRLAEPVVLIGATAVGTYLFFNLRSRRADSG